MVALEGRERKTKKRTFGESKDGGIRDTKTLNLSRNIV